MKANYQVINYASFEPYYNTILVINDTYYNSVVNIPMTEKGARKIKDVVGIWKTKS